MPEEKVTTRIETSPLGDPSSRTTPQPLVPGVEPGHILPLAEAAALAFLGVLALGAVLLLAVKAQFPNLGSGANVVDVLTSIVILALAILKTPVHLGDLTFAVLPLGALVAVFFIVRWACRAAGPSAPVRRAFVVGGLFAGIALVAALAFRFRFNPDAIYAGAFGAAIASFVWVTLFSALAFASSRGSLAVLAGRRASRVQEKRPVLFEGLRAAGLMLLVGAALATAAGLIWIIVVLISGGGPQSLDAGDLMAAIVYVVAFLPNLVIASLTLSLGAPIDVGAGLTIDGVLRGNVRQLSVIGEGAAILLLLVPLIACMAGGFWARRNTRHPSRTVVIIPVAALVFASLLALLAWLSEARLGAQLASARGFGVVAPRAWIVFLLGALWAGGAGFAGWIVADKRR